MKKIIIVLMSMLMMAPVVSEAKDNSKAIQKRAKQTEKRFTKEGWKLFGSSYTLREVLAKHYEKLEGLGDGGTELSGTATTTETKGYNLVIRAAETNAAVSYSGKCREVVGKTVNQMELTEREKDDFLATYETKVQAEIQGELQQSYVLIRESGKNQKDALVFYVVDDAAAEKARLRALEVATRGMKLAQNLRDDLNQAARKSVK